MEKHFLNFCVGGGISCILGLVLMHFNAAELVEYVKPQVIVVTLFLFMFFCGLITTAHPLQLHNKIKVHFYNFCVGSCIAGFTALVPLYLAENAIDLEWLTLYFLLNALTFGVVSIYPPLFEDTETEEQTANDSNKSEDTK